jgi:1-acyl-sn-glycerol-3-phosphate acyltransferase
MRRALIFPLAWLALQAQLLLLGLISISWNLAALLLYPLLSRKAGRRVGRAMISFGYRQFWRAAACSGMIRLHSEALDALRDEPGLIVVANHPSMLDALMLVARLPRSACVMKASLMRNPFLWPGARLARYIRNDSPHGMVRLAVADLLEGGQLVMFPEGTRTTRQPLEQTHGRSEGCSSPSGDGGGHVPPGRALNEFRSGFTLIAKLANAPIQAVFIDTDSPYLAKGWPLWRLPPLPIVFTVRMGKRFAPRADHAALLAEVEAYFAEGVRQAHAPNATNATNAPVV